MERADSLISSIAEIDSGVVNELPATHLNSRCYNFSHPLFSDLTQAPN